MNLSATTAERDSPTSERYSRAARVIAGWVRDRDFCDAIGNPRILPLHEGGPRAAASFAELVRRFSGGLPFRVVLDELKRAGVIEQLKDGSIRLKR